ncbi:YbjN domain-containing protein [Pseudaeromonas paramecii]|uniref:YbjN domain-containing protein n=1 Tax=Pseudaeromonas paramecii TaxID=2138166 RepID=A0ABP8PXH2_9GAMM
MLHIPNFDIIIRWLQQGQIPHYMCDQCHGIHMVDVQSMEGVLESRLFVESEGLLLSTELEVRPSGLLLLVSELGRLNMNYPALKIFVDVVDDNLPRLMVCASAYIEAGMTPEQLTLFVQRTLAATQQLISECEQLGVLNPPESGSDLRAVH